MLPRAPEERVRLLPRDRAHAALLPEAEGARRPPRGGRQARQGAAREAGGAQRQRRPPDQGLEPLRGADGLQHPREDQGGVPGARARAQEGAGAAGRLGRREHALGRPAGAAPRGEARRRRAAVGRGAGVHRRAAREAVADPRGDRLRRGVLRQRRRRRGGGRGARRAGEARARPHRHLPHPRARRQRPAPRGRPRHRAPAVLQPRRGLRRRALGRRLGLGLRRVSALHIL